jgi:2-dehydropantoate 2-reductase
VSERWHILGAGALGSLYAAFLERAGATVSILERSRDHLGQPVKDRQAHRREFNVISSIVSLQREYSFSTSRTADRSMIKRLLVATKSYDAATAVASVRHRLGKDSDVVLMSNGLGYQQEVAQAVPGPRYLYCLSTHGANWLSQHTLVHAGSGTSRLGAADSQRAPKWLALWEQAIPGTSWEPDIGSALWLKLIINAVINPITALTGKANGALNSDPALSSQVENLCSELSALTRATPYGHLAETLESEVRKVIAGTANNRSSMLQDITAGRPTEIQFINGYLAMQAKQLGLDAPLNEALYGAIAKLEAQNGSR